MRMRRMKARDGTPEISEQEAEMSSMHGAQDKQIVENSR